MKITVTSLFLALFFVLGCASTPEKPAAQPEGRLLPWEPAQLPAEVRQEKPAEPRREADAENRSESPRDSG